MEILRRQMTMMGEKATLILLVPTLRKKNTNSRMRIERMTTFSAQKKKSYVERDFMINIFLAETTV